MKRKGPQKHSTETIQSAIVKFQNGARLTDIAKELDVEKSTVKYWLDNASRFLAEGSAPNPVASRLQSRLVHETWDLIFLAIKTIKKSKLDDASLRDLVYLLSELFDRQNQFAAIAGRTAVPERVIEASEEVRITVKQFLQKRGPVDADPSKGGLGAAPVEQSSESPVQPEAAAVVDAETGGNGAT
jgi:transposase-like protein